MCAKKIKSPQPLFTFRKGNDPGKEVLRFHELYSDMKLSVMTREFGLGEDDAKTALAGFHKMIGVISLMFAETMDAMNSDIASWKKIERIDEMWRRERADLRAIRLPMERLSEKLPETIPAEVPDELRGLSLDYLKVFGLLDSEFTFTRYQHIKAQDISRAGIRVSKELKRCMDPANRDDIRAIILLSVQRTMRQLDAFHDERVMADLDCFMERFVAIGRSFGKNDEGRACFISMCRAMITKTARQTKSLTSRLSNYELNDVAEQLRICPYIMILDEPLLKRAEDISKSVRPRTASAIAANPAWVDPTEDFARLRELVALLEAEGQPPGTAEFISGTRLETALKMARIFNEDPGLLVLFHKLNNAMVRSTVKLMRQEYIDYILGVAWQKTGERTFHELLLEAIPGLTDRGVIGIIWHSESVCLSGLWPEIVQTVRNGNLDLAEDALDALADEDFEGAAAILRREKDAERAAAEARMAREELLLKDRISHTFPDATDEQKASFEKAVSRLSGLSIDPKRFTSLRKHGYERMSAASKAMDGMSDAAVLAVYKSGTVRGMFMKALDVCPDEDVARQLDDISRASQSTDQAQLMMEFQLGGLIDDARVVRKGKFSRIVLVAGEQVARTMASSLAENINIPVVTVTNGDANKAYMGSLLRQGDLVVIGVSHLGHSASNVAIATCRNLGIPFVIRRQTNVDFILKRVGQPDKPSGNGGSSAGSD